MLNCDTLVRDLRVIAEIRTYRCKEVASYDPTETRRLHALWHHHKT